MDTLKNSTKESNIGETEEKKSGDNRKQLQNTDINPTVAILNIKWEWTKYPPQKAEIWQTEFLKSN